MSWYFYELRIEFAPYSSGSKKFHQTFQLIIQIDNPISENLGDDERSYKLHEQPAFVYSNVISAWERACYIAELRYVYVTFHAHDSAPLSTAKRIKRSAIRDDRFPTLKSVQVQRCTDAT